MAAEALETERLGDVSERGFPVAGAAAGEYLADDAQDFAPVDLVDRSRRGGFLCFGLGVMGWFRGLFRSSLYGKSGVSSAFAFFAFLAFGFGASISQMLSRPWAMARERSFLHFWRTWSGRMV